MAPSISQEHEVTVRQSLVYSAVDKAQNKPNPSKVELKSDLYRDLSALRTTVNYYKRYRGETQPRPNGEAVNQAIDECATLGVESFLDTYGFGKDIDYWVVRDQQRYPSKAVFGVAHQFMPGGTPLDGKACDGTTAREHLKKLGFEIVKGEGTGVSGPPITLFDSAGIAYAPEKQKNQQTGVMAYRAKPADASIETLDAQEIDTDLGVATAILLDRLPVRIKPVAGGVSNYLKYGAGKLISYRLRPDVATAMGPGFSETGKNVDMENHRQGSVNLILYGPPGTGKTWRTAAEAVSLCDGVAPSDRDALMKRYGELVEARRIDFVTFHQSYSYEEFVEGLRPSQAGSDPSGEPTSSAGFSLLPEDGVFRRIARRAAASRGGGGHYAIGDRRVFKLSIGEAAK